MATATYPPQRPPGFSFDMRISLGHIIQLLVLLAAAAIAWGANGARQTTADKQQEAQGNQILELTKRLENSAEIEARTAGDLDQMERRVNRLENEIDGRK